MAHVREQLRQAIRSTLDAYAPLTAIVPLENISTERIKVFQQVEDIHSGKTSQFPAVNIIVNDDETDQAFFSCGKYEVEQSVDIEVYVNDEDDYGTAIDQIVVEIQKALFVDPKLGLPIIGVRYARSRMSVNLTETIYAARVLTYTYEYRVDYTDPEQFA